MSDPQLIFPPLGEKGVALAPATAISLDIHRLVAESLKGVEDGKTMAVLAVHTHKGFNLAVAHREDVTTGLFAGQWVTELWVGKSGWDQAPVAGGVNILFSK